MASKVYAVRKGSKTGIFDTWDECQAATKGYSGAEFKSFKSLDDAKLWMNGDDSVGAKPNSVKEKIDIPAPIFDDECNVYTDGSYKDGVASFGIYIQTNKHDLKFSGAVDCTELYGSMQNVLGEILAVYVAMQLVKDMGLMNVTLLYDYEGVHSWASGAWKCNGELQSNYAMYMQNLIRSGSVSIKFKHVKGHSGVAGNVVADNLAKHGRERGKILKVQDVLRGNIKVQDVHLAR